MPATRNSVKPAKKINHTAKSKKAQGNHGVKSSDIVDWSMIQKGFELREAVAYILETYRDKLKSTVDRLERGALVVGFPASPPPPEGVDVPAAIAEVAVKLLRNLQCELTSVPACDFGALPLGVFNRGPVSATAMRRFCKNPLITSPAPQSTGASDTAKTERAQRMRSQLDRILKSGDAWAIRFITLKIEAAARAAGLRFKPLALPK